RAASTWKNRSRRRSTLPRCRMLPACRGTCSAARSAPPAMSSQRRFEVMPPPHSSGSCGCGRSPASCGSGGRAATDLSLRIRCGALATAPPEAGTREDAVPRSTALATLTCLAFAGGLLTAQARTFKVAFYNIRSGMGIQPLGGRPAPFAETVNCDPASGRVNAWGAGKVQAELAKSVKNDPLVLALGLAEAWNCASPKQVREALQWKADSGERNGVALLARYGFSNNPEFLQLDTSTNKNPRDTMWIVRGRVCLDDTCSGTVDVYATHWSGNGPHARETYDRQAQQSVEFMARSTAAHALVGDLNVFEGDAPVCGQMPNNSSLTFLRR